MNFCPNCGNKVSEAAKFCGGCGTTLAVSEDLRASSAELNQQQTANIDIKSSTEGIFRNATKAISKYTGEEESLNVNLKELFSEVSKKHTAEESDEIFIVGTEKTTPITSEISTDWSKPWLFSRVFLSFLAVFIMLYVMVSEFENENAIPGLIFVGACIVPLSALIFFFETNAYKNISIFTVIKIFAIGGVCSLLSTLFLYEFVDFSMAYKLFDEMTAKDAFTVGLVEEVGKLIIIAFCISHYKVNKILNGLLIGASIGAGFAVFETAGYILRYAFIEGDFLDITVLRGWTSLGGHLVWGAILGGALIVSKGSEKLSINHFFDGKFLFFFASVIAMHGLWDMGIVLLNSHYTMILILIVFAWVEVFILMNAGLKEVARTKSKGEINVNIH